MKEVIGIDLETYDPHLKTSGYSWKYREGYILCSALYFYRRDEVVVFSGINNTSSPFTDYERKAQNEKIKNLLLREDVTFVGANIIYDLGWLLYEYGMDTYEVKASFVDVLQAEAILDEWGFHSLESVSKKYLGYGKEKGEIEEWVKENVSARGDFRGHLDKAPWNLLKEYVETDAKNPVKVWAKQISLLEKEDLLERFRLEADCILPTLQMTMYGMPIDVNKKKENFEFLSSSIENLEKSFTEKYKFPSFRVTASRDIARLCDTRSIPYNYKFTLTGVDGEKFKCGKDTDEAFHKAKRIVSSFCLEKGKPVAYVPSALEERTSILLSDEGFIFNKSPNIDRKFFDSMKEKYPEIALISDWKLSLSICSKFLGNNYDRFITRNFKGEPCIKPQFKITDTVSFRFSSNNPNSQQLFSKGILTLHTEIKETEISLPSITRALFTASKGCVFGKIDYGQIEYRLICNIACGKAGEEVREEYRRNPHLDFHQYVVDLTGLSRKYAKNMSFGVSFGLGINSMMKTFGWTAEEAESIAQKYHARMPFVAPTLALVGDVAKKRGYIKTAYGSHARLKDEKKAYTMLNRYTQGSGAECLKLSIVKAYNEGVWKKLKPANTVHDELNFPYLEPTESSMKALYRMAEIMREALPSLRVPLEATPEIGDNWAETKEVKEWIKLRDEKSGEWDKASPELKKAVSICERLIKEGSLQPD